MTNQHDSDGDAARLLCLLQRRAAKSQAKLSGDSKGRGYKERFSG